MIHVRHVRSRGRMRAIALVSGVVLTAALAITATGLARPAATPLEMAQKVLDAATPPATIFAKTKSTKPLPTGSDVQLSYIHCGQPGCDDVSNGVKAAIDGLKLGWKYTVIPTDGSPQGVQNGWKTAMENGSDVVFGTGWPVSYFAQQLKDAVSKNVPIFSGYVLDKPQKGFYPMGGASDVTTVGKQMAAWISVKTQAKASVLYVGLPAFPILRPVTTSFKKWMPVYCPGCKVDSIDLALTDIGKTAPAKVVAFLRAHPDVNYIAYNYDGVGVGIPAALKVAGLDKKVKIIGESPSSQNLADVAAGRQEMTVTQGYYEAMASVVNQMARALSGQPVIQAEMKLDYWAFKKGSPKSWAGSGQVAVKDLYSQYLKLWPTS